MPTRRVETLVWVLIYAGMFIFALGLAVRAADAVLGHGMVVLGLVLAVAGIVLIWVRSRMRAHPNPRVEKAIKP